MFSLRPYQLDTNRALWRAFENYDSVLLQAPTGAGKTLMAAHYIAMRQEHRKERTLVLAHRREIVRQTAAKFMEQGLETGVIMAGHAPYIFSPTQVGSIDTVWARKHRGFPDAELLVIDECHRIMGDRYTKVVDHYRSKGAKILGLTATPMRNDGQGLGKIFQYIVRTPDIQELQQKNFLCPVRYCVGSAPDMTGIKTQGGDYDLVQREAAADKGQLIGDIVTNWKRYASDRKTLVFASGVKHSIHIVEQFVATGIKAEHIDGDTPHEIRDKVYEQLNSGEIQVVSNAMVYVEGTDIPCISCLIDAAPTKSLIKYLQAGGRLMRMFPGKIGLYLDHASNVRRHGRLEMPRDWMLTQGKEQVEHLDEQRRKTEKLQVACERCGYLLNSAICSNCGYTYTPKGEAIGFLPGMLLEMTAEKLDHAITAKKKRATPPEESRQSWYGGFLWIAKERGYNEGWAAHKYKQKFGDWPNNLSKIATPPVAEVLRYEKHLRIRYAMSKQTYGSKQKASA